MACTSALNCSIRASPASIFLLQAPQADFSHNANGIDAIQFEFGVNYRQEAKLESTIKRAAKSIVAFYDGYLKPPAN